MNKNKNGKENGITAFEAACTYISSRMRTKAETAAYLENKGFNGLEINEAVEELSEMKYLDDYEFSLRYYEYNREKKRGVLRAEQELINKGVDRETASNAKEDFLHESATDEFALALEIAREEFFPDTDDVRIDEKLIAKAARKLETKGFTKSDIYKILEKMRVQGREDE